MVNYINEFPTVGVPKLPNLPRPKITDASPKLPICAGACYSMNNAGYKLGPVLNFFKGKPFLDWAEGKESPFKEKKIAKIKNKTQSVWKRFSTSVMTEIVAQSILIVDSYRQQFDFLMPSKIPGVSPKMVLLVPIARLYTHVNEALEAIRTIMNSESKLDTDFGYGALVAATFKILLDLCNFICLSIYYKYFYEVAPLANLTILGATSLSAVIELVQSNDCSQKRSLAEQITHRANPAELLKV